MRQYLLGVGLILMAVYNPSQPLLDYILLPQIGIMLLVGAIVARPFKDFKKVGLGPKWVWIPLLVLSATITASGFAQYFRGEVSLVRGIAPFVSTLVWFGVYLVARMDGDNLGKPMAIAVIIESISIVISSVITNGVRNGGIISPTNYDIATAFLVFGTFLSPRKWQWWVGSIAIVGLFFTGAEEGIVAIGVTALVVLIVKDYSLKTLLPVVTLIVALLVATPMGITHNLYIGDSNVTALKDGGNPTTLNKFQAVRLAIREWGTPGFSKNMDIATGYRWSTHWRIRPIQPFGYGYNLTQFYQGIPHNIILIIIEQVGIIGVAAWLVGTGYCLKISKRYYLWASVIALGILDHYSWTQIAPWWWAMVGVSEAHRYKTANIFKGGDSGKV